MKKTLSDKNKRICFFLQLAGILLCTCATVYSDRVSTDIYIGGFLSVGGLVFSLRYLPLILLSGVFGEVPGMLCVLIVFLHNLFLDRNVAFLNFIYLVIVVATYSASGRRCFWSVRKTLLYGLSLTVLTGNLWGV
ncbi:MAG: hypothetical protein K5696_05660 [Lachnospiraceae bacterium]|nr:hypothetical protein [Lachnospiraceae bacterium]